jgi:hypothetical protein
MIRHLILALIVTCSSGVYAQHCASSSYYPTIHKSGKTITSFVPKHWKIFAEAHGDLNKDGRSDEAVVLETVDSVRFIDKIYPTGTMQYSNDSTYPSKSPDTLFRDVPLRMLFIVLRDSTNIFQLSAQSNHVIPLADEGGMMGDPFDDEDLSIKRGSLFIEMHSGGGSFRSSEQLQFRHQDSDWYLIGCKESNFEMACWCSCEYDFNLLTGAAKFTFLNENDTSDFRTVQENIGKHPLSRFESYQVWEDPPFLDDAIQRVNKRYRPLLKRWEKKEDDED